MLQQVEDEHDREIISLRCSFEGERRAAEDVKHAAEVRGRRKEVYTYISIDSEACCGGKRGGEGERGRDREREGGRERGISSCLPHLNHSLLCFRRLCIPIVDTQQRAHNLYVQPISISIGVHSCSFVSIGVHLVSIWCPFGKSG